MHASEPSESAIGISPPSGTGATNLGLSTPNVDLVSPETECSICLDTMEQPVGGEWGGPPGVSLGSALMQDSHRLDMLHDQ